MFEVSPRKEPSRAMIWLTPVLAVILTVLAGLALFAALGKDPVETIRVIFVQPFLDPFSRTELLVKGAPLILIAIGLSMGFRAGTHQVKPDTRRRRKLERAFGSVGVFLP